MSNLQGLTLAELLLTIGPIRSWASGELTPDEIAAHVKTIVQGTIDYHGIEGGRVRMWGLADDEEAIMSHVGTSPNSEVIAAAMVMLWNSAVEEVRAKWGALK